MPDSQGLFTELKRRHVIRAAIAHIVFFWLLVQVADVVLPYIGVVDEPVRWALVAGVALFPVTLIAAWFLEHPWHRVTSSRLMIDVIVIGVVAVTAGMWVVRNLPQVVYTRTSIVILPFEHSGTEHEQGLSRALAYEINHLLMRSNSIDVSGFESANSTLLVGLGTMAVADRLKVNNVLSGNVSMSGETMRIEMRLLDAAGELLWNNLIEDSLDNLFAVQERIAVAIESRLGAGEDAISVAEVAAQRCWMPTDPLALENYYTARHYVELRTNSEEAQLGLREAVRLYKELVAEYPEFAEARAGLAWAYLYQSNYDPENALANPNDEVQPLAHTALQHCPTLGEAMHLLPNQFDHENDWIGQHQQMLAAIEMEAYKSENYQRLSRHYLDSGHQDRSVDISTRNYELNPLSVRSVKELAFALQHVGRYAEASEMFELSIELGNTGPNFAAGLAELDECGEDFKCLMSFLPPYYQQFADMLRPVYRIPATGEEAEESIRLAMKLYESSPGNLTNWFNDSACRFDHLQPLFFEVWERSQEVDAYWYWPNVWNGNCAGVWTRPEFSALVEEVGLVEYWREVGWPEACQPNDEGFACGRNIVSSP